MPKLTGDLTLEGTSDNYETEIEYSEDSQMIGLSLSLKKPQSGGGGGGTPLEVDVYSRDSGGIYNDTDFSGQTGLNSAVSGNNLTIDTKGGDFGRHGTNVFLTSELKTVDSAATYSLKFTRGGVDANDTNNVDRVSSTALIAQGFNFGFIFNKTPSQVVLIQDFNQGYAVSTQPSFGDNVSIMGKVCRIPSNLDDAGVCYRSSPSTESSASNTAYSPSRDLTDGDIELRIEPVGGVYVIKLFANENEVVSLTTDINPATATTILPYFHLNNWTSTDNYSTEVLTNVTFTG